MERQLERQLNVPPHSIEAEQGVLGGLLLDNRAWDLVADKVHPEDFYRNDHRQIFGAILELADRGEPFDIVTVSEFWRVSPAGVVSLMLQSSRRTRPQLPTLWLTPKSFLSAPICAA